MEGGGERRKGEREREREKKLRGGGRVMERVATGEEGGKSRSRAPRREERSLRERAREKGEGGRERARERGNAFTRCAVVLNGRNEPWERSL